MWGEGRGKGKGRGNGKYSSPISSIL